MCITQQTSCSNFFLALRATDLSPLCTSDHRIAQENGNLNLCIQSKQYGFYVFIIHIYYCNCLWKIVPQFIMICSESDVSWIFCCLDCQENTYGQNCSSVCGHCKGGQPCDTKTGECTSGCEPGYKGQNCQTGMLMTGCVSFSIHIVRLFKEAIGVFKERSR